MSFYVSPCKAVAGILLLKVLSRCKRDFQADGDRAGK